MVETHEESVSNGQQNGQSQEPLITNALNNVAQILQTLATNPPMQQPRTQNRAYFLSEFRKQRPPTFQGTPDPLVANHWIRQIKKMLEALGVQLSADQIALATYQFEGEVDCWWEATKTTINLATLMWAQFEAIFLEKYFLAPMKDEMTQKFMTLRKGNMTVTQYMSRFDELSRFATEYIPTESAKARKFEWGLDHALKEKATLIKERELNDYYKIGDAKRAAPQQGGPIRNNNQGYVAPKPYSQNNHRPKQHNQPYQPWRNPNPNSNPNPGPNRNHFPQNQYPGRRCYFFHEEGRIQVHCPKLIQVENQGEQPSQNQVKTTGSENQNQARPIWNGN
ncbi:uncharacterized protein LOC131327754 [Rhododendron vialii]|uniref:uncharacterized protein LOC131327754 n=1 Tax=Rhododendron vialii TaxID=182163 RepID=UPI00265E6EFB|nr:uncharacterized protein LOC131327754 [Rhododendron vialii]